MFLKKKFLPFLFLLGSIVTIISLSRSVIRTYRRESRLSNLRKEVALAEEKIKELSQKVQEQENDQFVEQQARDKLNMAKPGEKIVIVNKEQTSQEQQILGQATENLNTNLAKWHYLFFGH
ncbi:hypothetical protein B5M47_00035 [candidate division CPR3 bacterium 4484_211]|uniref:Cell division protein FtsL n=1 Tax=candidate division CPR3 bacterium 4484_211 TaxID=1968527 RepID=A0A1W9NZK8_UNCC3|nr:MAG: hypothetical protein B5M47_00035 [candidate division CPR3 bacterium 4484_211]